MTAIYLINPRARSQAYFGAEIYEASGFGGVHLVADLTMTTLAALVPDDYSIRLCDETLGPVDLDAAVDVVALTGKTSQVGRMLELADHFRQRGRLVVIGGPHASLAPETVRAHCDVLVRGEVEEIAATLFADLRDGTWKAEYVGEQADLSRAPIPRWDLYPNHRALMGAVQTSRGCPFKCEFCEVPTYAGRVQRRKRPDQVIAELDVLYAHGYRSVFLVDDNFTASRRDARALLTALAQWNDSRPAGPVSFATQVSVDVARDADMLALCAGAGLSMVFVGLETPSEESLREAGKRQNLGGDLLTMVDRFLAHGITVIGGLIVGFDSDGPDIFERQRRFVAASAVPVFTLGALVASSGSPLHSRLAAAGRLLPDKAFGVGEPWNSNIVPAGMSGEDLMDGLRHLCNHIYSPQAFGDRMVAMLDRLGRSGRAAPFLAPIHQDVAAETAEVIKRLAARGPQERALVGRVGRHALTHCPQALSVVQNYLRFYAQIRHVFAMTGLSV